MIHVQRGPGHKHEKFVAGIFTQIRPVWIGEYKLVQKLEKFIVGALYFYFYGRENFFYVGDSGKKYIMAIFNPKQLKLVPMSSTHTGMNCVKTPEPNMSSLVPFNDYIHMSPSAVFFYM